MHYFTHFIELATCVFFWLLVSPEDSCFLILSVPLILVTRGLLPFFPWHVSLSLCVPCSFALHFAFCCFRTGHSRELFKSDWLPWGGIYRLLVLLHQRLSLTLYGHTCFVLLALSLSWQHSEALFIFSVCFCLFLTTPGNLRDLRSWPGIEPQPMAVKAPSPNHHRPTILRVFMTHQAGCWKLLLRPPAGGVTAQVCGFLLCP